MGAGFQGVKIGEPFEVTTDWTVGTVCYWRWRGPTIRPTCSLGSLACVRRVGLQYVRGYN